MGDQDLFIAVEGTDGSGKSAQVRRLVERFKSLGYEAVPDPAHVPLGGRPCVLATREPSDGPVGTLIRQALRGEVELSAESMGYLYAADRRDHLARVVQPALAAGREAGVVVITDRYALSNVVYRAAEAGGPLLVCKGCGWQGEPGGRGKAWDETQGGRECPTCTALLNLTPAVLERARWARSLDTGLLVPTLTVVLEVPPWTAAARRRARGGVVERYDDGRLQARCCILYRHAAELVEGEVVQVDGGEDEEEVGEDVWLAVVTPDQRWARAEGGKLADHA